MFFSVLLAALSVVVLDGKEISKRLIGGTAAEPGEFPWMGRIQDIGCGAVMIHPRVVITAAHCVCKMIGRQCVRIRKAFHTLVVGGIRIHDDFADITYFTHDNISLHGGKPSIQDSDLAVILLNENYLNDTLSTTIALPNSSPEMDKRKEECYTLGWGFSGNCLSKLPTKYNACGGNGGYVEFHKCFSLGCCHYMDHEHWEQTCYYYEGQCEGISHKPCWRLDIKNKFVVTEAECHEYGCCYNKSSGETGECYDNSNTENYSKKVLEKVEGYGQVDEYGWIKVVNPDPEKPKGFCVGDSGGPYVCRKFGTKVWKLYGIVSQTGNCGVDGSYWNVYKSLEFILSVVPKDVADDLRKKAGLSCGINC